MPRLQCLVARNQKVLMVRHRVNDEEYWCLPGGGLETDETPAQGALRELEEECGVRGHILYQTSSWTDTLRQTHHTFYIDIGEQTPKMGSDPELAPDAQVIVDVAWIALDQLSERDRVYLWSAGLLGVPGFFEEICRWPAEPTNPLKPGPD